MDYLVTATVEGTKAYLRRRQNREKPLLSDSVTQDARYAHRWTDADGAGFDLADAELFRVHAQSHSPIGWSIEACA